MLNKLKLYLNIQNDNKDELLQLLIDMAQDAIKGYCNIAELDDSFNSAIIKLASYFYSKRDSDGITQMSQGSRYKAMTNDIPADIKAMLPLPRVRVIG